MVDVGGKPVTERVAVAAGHVAMAPSTLALISGGGHRKGDVLAVARVAGIQAAKQCPQLIPLCHPLMLSGVEVALEPDPANSRVLIRASCRVAASTGVEMEALTAVSVAALTVYDMCKAVDRGITIGGIRLEEKRGGRGGTYRRAEEGG